MTRQELVDVESHLRKVYQASVERERKNEGNIQANPIAKARMAAGVKTFYSHGHDLRVSEATLFKRHTRSSFIFGHSQPGTPYGEFPVRIRAYAFEPARQVSRGSSGCGLSHAICKMRSSRPEIL